MFLVKLQLFIHLWVLHDRGVEIIKWVESCRTMFRHETPYYKNPSKRQSCSGIEEKTGLLLRFFPNGPPPTQLYRSLFLWDEISRDEA